MRPAYVVEITTPKKYLLNGLWFGPKKPKRVVVWVHGLGSSAFSGGRIIPRVLDRDTAVLAFNNRGHDGISRVSRIVGKSKKSIAAGTAHEVFEQCVDDIQGAINFAKKAGAKKIYLAGHSTGCQKSVFYAAQKKVDRKLKGVILLGPLSDYAVMLKKYGRKKLASIAAMARHRKPNELMGNIWPELIDAQRFLSLYTPESSEEIFSYIQPDKKTTALAKVRVPVLVLWAGAEEYDSGLSDQKILEWFRKSIRSEKQIELVAGATHTFRGAEEKAAKFIKNWLSR